MAPKMGEVLARFDFPLYTLQFIDDKHFLVAGGGGGAKTGIPNAVEVRCARANQIVDMIVSCSSLLVVARRCSSLPA